MTNLEYIRTCTKEELVELFCVEFKTDCFRCVARECCYNGHTGFIDWLDKKRGLDAVKDLPSAQPYTAEEIQKVRELVAVQIEKAYELGRKSVQPEQKKGEWVLGFNNQYLEKYYYCSKCGNRKYEEYKPLDYFCSNCGADMRGEKDE